MPYRNKTYVVFDGDEDMTSYRLMCAWAANQNASFNFHNAHDLNTARDDSLTDSIKAQLRTRLANTKLMLVLVGQRTKGLRKFVPWEIEQAVERDIPLIGINLNGSRQKDDNCPAALAGTLAVFTSFKQKIIEHAMDTWPDEHTRFKAERKSSSYFYGDAIYSQLGLTS
jgi:hypothetical protein